MKIISKTGNLAITVILVLSTALLMLPLQTNAAGFDLFSLFFGNASTAFDPIVSIVQVPGTTQVYRIVAGMKHLMPNAEIFASYGYTEDIIQPINVIDLAKYPLARLFVVAEDETETIYYLTTGGMIRPMLNDEVFFSYGNRKEDVVYITAKEFNFYPRNKFIFVEQPFISRDVFQIVGGVKRYVTPMAVKRMKIKDLEVAPVNITEFDAYPSSTPIVF